jgi:SAM-dependent methyltransferase
VLADPWLKRWLPTIRDAARGAPVLEIGCGSGADTATLLSAGLEVVAFDLSPENVAKAKAIAPGATISAQDVLGPFPLEGLGIGVVIASLSLHYFTWDETLSLMGRIHRTLRPSGLFLVRLNSTEDIHYGSVGHPEIEPGLFMVDGSPKRFFSAVDVNNLFGAGWRVTSIQHMESDKYGQPKFLWEVAVESGGLDTSGSKVPI